jgi:hypothetical protein
MIFYCFFLKNGAKIGNFGSQGKKLANIVIITSTLACCRRDVDGGGPWSRGHEPGGSAEGQAHQGVAGRDAQDPDPCSPVHASQGELAQDFHPRRRTLASSDQVRELTRKARVQEPILRFFLIFSYNASQSIFTSEKNIFIIIIKTRHSCVVNFYYAGVTTQGRRIGQSYDEIYNHIQRVVVE